MVLITCLAFIITYLYGKSKGNLFSAILLHWVASYSASVVATGVSRTTGYTNVEFIPSLIVIVFIIVMMIREKSKNTQNLSAQQVM
jgi:membrane protease YdiL (CAAX protease family)